MKNILDRKGNVKCKFAGLEQMKVKVLVNIVEIFMLQGWEQEHFCGQTRELSS